MTSNRLKAWQAQVPEADFAERTVAALARDRRRRRTLTGRRWIVMGAMAAVLIAGGAWGYASLSSLQAHSRAAPFATPPTIRAPDPSPRQPVALPEHPAPVSPASPPASLPHRKVEAPAPVSSPPNAGRTVVVPRCYCSPNEAICDCF
jgi:hypothetical protein